MMISTRGRYALRVLADLAEHRSEGFVPMKDVAARQEISLKYMEKILPVLTKNHIVDGIQGKGGGYRLSREPGEYTLGEILRLTEGSLAPVACLECGAKACLRRKNGCSRRKTRRNSAADGRIPCAGSLPGMRREALSPGGELSDAAGLERAGQTHQRVLRQRDAGRFGEKVKERPRRRRYCAAGAFCCV